ncbi:MAG: hypothetical protein D6805_05510 [Planctomycetota bacterium]|nr:MAG: hypothetical protein D6805_05510 [Planctomycetota bacterium]
MHTIGIEIGINELRAVRLQGSGKHAEVEKTLHFSATTPKERAQALHQIFRQLFRKQSVCAISIPAQKAILREYLSDYTQPELIAKTIHFASEPLLPQELTIDDVVLCYHKAGEVEVKKEKKSRILLAFLPKTTIAEYLQLCQENHIDPDQIDIDITALFNGLKSLNCVESEQNQIVLALEQNVVKILLLSKGQLVFFRCLYLPSSPSNTDASTHPKKTRHSSRVQKQKPNPKEATGIYEFLLEEIQPQEEEEEEEISLEDFEIWGVESSDDSYIAFEEDWEIASTLESEDSSILYLQEMSETNTLPAIQNEPIAVLSEEEFEALEIYEEGDEVSALDEYLHKLSQKLEQTIVYAQFNQEIHQILLINSLPQTPRIADYLQNHFQIPLLNIEEKLAKEKVPYLTSIGLAMKELQQDEVRFDFRQGEFRSPKRSQKIQKSFALTLFLIFCILFVLFQHLQQKLEFTQFQVQKSLKEQNRVYQFLFREVAPGKPLYPENIPASIDDKIEELQEQIGTGKGIPKITSPLVILKELAQAKEKSKVSFQLLNLYIGQKGIQISGKIPNNRLLGRFVRTIQKSSKILKVTGSNFSNGVGNINLEIQKETE